MRQINSCKSLPGLMLCIAFYSPYGWALQSDREQPIEIQADRVELNEKTEISRYQGQVRLQQGTLKISADTVTVYMKKGKLNKIIIDGKPARFEQQPEDHKEVVTSHANHMEYSADKERLILQNDALVVQGANNFSGDYIEYDTLNSTVKANKNEGSDSRVHAIIVPSGDKSKPKQDSSPKQPKKPVTQPTPIQKP